MAKGFSITRKYSVPTGTIWPSGDFSVGLKWVDRHGPHKHDRRTMLQAYDESQSGRWTVEAQEQREVYSYPGGWADAVAAEECYQNPSFFEEGAGAPLTLANAPNSHTAASRPEKYGKTGITGYGRKMVRSAATLIQKMPNKRITFATVTLPTLPMQLRAELARQWPEFVRQLLQILSRWLKREGLPALVCSVSEIQPKRLEETDEGYLHLHLIWPNHWAKSGNWAIDVDRLRSWCCEFLQNRGIWVDGAWVRVNVQQVRKTAAGYLSKYMSKGVEEIEAFAADCGWDCVPGQWWNLTKPARDLVKKYTRRGEDVGAMLSHLASRAIADPQGWGFWYIHPIEHDLGDRVVIVGWVGNMLADLRKDLIKQLDTMRRTSSI